MGSKERKGTRRDRSKKLSTRVPTLGYYLIVTDTQIGRASCRERV